MLQPPQHFWQHHTDVSPFATFSAGLQASMDALMQPASRDAAGSSSQSMQVDEAPAASQPAASSAAGSSGASGSGTQEDVAMAPASAPPARKARNAADAPMRKLSVNLIDTYKTINQARAPSAARAARAPTPRARVVAVAAGPAAGAVRAAVAPRRARRPGARAPGRARADPRA